MRYPKHKPSTRGGEALQRWLAHEQRSQRWLADQLRREGEQLHPGTVSAWIGGKLTPATPYAVRIEELTGIPVRWWTEELHLPFDRRLASGAE